MTRHGLLRGLAVVMLAVAVADPGCDQPRRAPVVVVAAPDVADDDVARVRRVLDDVWPSASAGQDGPHALRVGVGAPRALMALHRTRPLTLAVRIGPSRPHVRDLVVPRVMVAGLVSRLRVGLSEWDGASGSRVVVRDLATGQEVGQAPVVGDEGPWVDVALLPPAPGAWRVCVAVSAGGTEDDCDVVAVDVLPATVRVEVLEARPSWAARFARLALEGWDGAHVEATVRVASPISVTTRPAQRPDTDRPADVLLVAGLDALDARDVARLTAAAREQGRTVVLLADAPVEGTRLRDLWPHPLRAAPPGAVPAPVQVGPHRWRAREWLVPSTSTDTEALAYLEVTPRVPVILARALGAGRVVLITALDAWRWRDAEDVAFDTAWRSLVVSLAADAHIGARPASWRVPGDLRDEVHVAVPPQMRGDMTVGVPAAHLEAGDTPLVSLSETAGLGARGVVRVVPGETATRVRVPHVAVGADAAAVIDVGSASDVPATWDDVTRVLEGAGGRVVHEDDLGAAARGLTVPDMPDGTRWYPTRHWAFAAVIVMVLGLEWWWRRLARLR